MRKAIESLETVSADEKMLEAYRAREKARRDEISKLAYAEKQKAKKIAEEMFKDGVGIEKVAKYTELSVEELQGIENKVKSERN